MSNCLVYIIIHWITAVNHQPVDKLHGLSTLTPQLARHNHLTAFSATFHDETQHAITSPATENQLIVVNNTMKMIFHDGMMLQHLLCELYHKK